MSEKLFHSVYKAASQITVHRYANAVGPAGKGTAPKSSEKATATRPSAKSAKPPKKG